MTADKLADAILNKCDIYYGGALISKEAIIEKYLAFFAKSLVSKERTINFALHTGSVCFDVISVVAVALGCLSYNLSTNDDIISSLQPNDMVLFKGQRYRWKGTGFEYGSLCMILQQDGKGKNGKTTSYLPLDRNKHLIKPYYPVRFFDIQAFCESEYESSIRQCGYPVCHGRYRPKQTGYPA